MESLKIIEKSDRVAIILYDPWKLSDGAEFIPKEIIRKPEDIGIVINKYT